jgi:hypothetical protein
LYWLTAYQVELEALPAFLGNRSLHGDIIPADYILHIRIMAEFVVSTPEGKAQNTVMPSNCIVLTDHLRSLIRVVRFELEPKPLLTIHTVLPNYVAAVAHSTGGRPKHVAPPFLFHQRIEATIRRPS